MTAQPEALRLAYHIDAMGFAPCISAAAELRRLHEANENLVQVLKLVQVSIYTDDYGQLRLTSLFDDSIIDIAIAKAEGL